MREKGGGRAGWLGVDVQPLPFFLDLDGSAMVVGVGVDELLLNLLLVPLLQKRSHCADLGRVKSPSGSLSRSLAVLPHHQPPSQGAPYATLFILNKR